MEIEMRKQTLKSLHFSVGELEAVNYPMEITVEYRLNYTPDYDGAKGTMNCYIKADDARKLNLVMQVVGFFSVTGYRSGNDGDARSAHVKSYSDLAPFTLEIIRDTFVRAGLNPPEFHMPPIDASSVKAQAQE